MEPLNKGHVAVTLGPANLSVLERLSTLQRFKMYCEYGKTNIWDFEVCPLYIPLLGGSFIGGSISVDTKKHSMQEANDLLLYELHMPLLTFLINKEISS